MERRDSLSSEGHSILKKKRNKLFVYALQSFAFIINNTYASSIKAYVTFYISSRIFIWIQFSYLLHNTGFKRNTLLQISKCCMSAVTFRVNESQCLLHGKESATFHFYFNWKQEVPLRQIATLSNRLTSGCFFEHYEHKPFKLRVNRYP